LNLLSPFSDNQVPSRNSAQGSAPDFLGKVVGSIHPPDKPLQSLRTILARRLELHTL
jgi:hypothetical protein